MKLAHLRPSAALIAALGFASIGATQTTPPIIVIPPNTTPLTPLPVANVSARGQLKGPGDTFILGFVITTTDTLVLVRAIGPSLGQFGVGTPLADPVITVHDSTGNVIARGSTYEDQSPNSIFSPTELISSWERSTGAFPISRDPPTKDQAAAPSALPPGAYTLHITSQSGGTGTVLGEIYFVDNRTTTATDN